MKNINLNHSYDEYLERYKSEKIQIQPKELKRIITEAAAKAKENYNKLTDPKTCSIDVYTNIWVWQSISYDLAKKSVMSIDLKQPPFLLKATANFHLLFPKEKQIRLKRELFDVAVNKRRKFWDSFNLPIQKIDKNFKEMVKERNNFAKNKGYSTRIDMSLKLSKIPQKDFTNFIEDKDKIIEYCNQHLPKTNDLPDRFYSEFNIPCFICRLFHFPLNSAGETFEIIANKHKVLNKFRNKVNIKLGDVSKMSYRSTDDSFEIIINGTGNVRHQTTDLIHELSHVIYYLESFNKEINPLTVGAYLREKESTKIEIAILKNLSEQLSKVLVFNETLLLIHRTLFEYELYKNPTRDLGKLYASTFNKCFKGAEQKFNSLFLLDESIIFSPFSTLSHTVACTYILDDLIKVN